MSEVTTTKEIPITCTGSDMLSIDSITDFQGNLKTITNKEYEKLKSSIQRYGFSFPIFIWKNGKNNIIAGHQRLMALRKMRTEGYSVPNDSVPVSYIDAKDEKEAKKKVLLATSQYAKTTTDGLYEFLSLNDISFEDIKTDIDIPTINLDRFENEFYRDIVEDDAPPLPKEAVSKTGEIYQLGKHRLMCGDSTKREDVELLMNGSKADIVFTDPPYGVDYGAKNRFLNSFQPSGRNLEDITNDSIGKDELFDMLVKAFSLAREFGQDHCSYYVTAPQGGELCLMMMMMMIDQKKFEDLIQKKRMEDKMKKIFGSNLPTRHVLIWNKNSQNFYLGRLDYEYKHEPILFTWKETHKFYGNGDFLNSVWDIPKERKSESHPTTKPVALMVNALLNSSQSGGICLDLFGGSGSTLIACEQTKRTCYMMEIDPLYCDVIRRRYEIFTRNDA